MKKPRTGMRKLQQHHRHLCNENGQMAIFVALIFQVLFVLFAMVVNVALVVHDKINLQNSVDMAAYYVAQRQAEYLGAIAHTNYQIRQSWKLLTWRYRVLSTLGLNNQSITPHPARINGVQPDSPYSNYPTNSAGEPIDAFVCITFNVGNAFGWTDISQPGQNLCKKSNFQVPPLPSSVPVIAGFTGFNFFVNSLTQSVYQSVQDQCDIQGAYNFVFAHMLATAYKWDQSNRKAVIRALAGNLSNGQSGSFVELFSGQQVRQGAFNTFRKNLTFENRVSLNNQTGSFQVMNSLQGIPREVWLPEINADPSLWWADVVGAGGGASCSLSIRPLRRNNAPQDPQARAYALNNLGGNQLRQFFGRSNVGNDITDNILGVEKNPWYMVYAGVQATTEPRQLFFPFGPNIQLKAQGYAKPFGGRIGPWYAGQWPQGESRSIGDQLDPHLPPRYSFVDSDNVYRNFPNYSRYPGDPYGLKSRMAQEALPGLGGLTINFRHYQEIANSVEDGRANDFLAWNRQNATAPEVRSYELAAIAPDLFDITYYSIDPNFNNTYLPALRQNKDALGITVPLRGDLGSRPNVSMTIAQQIEDYGQQNLGGDFLHRKEAYYFVREPAHILTSWTPGERATQQAIPRPFPDDEFANCGVLDFEQDLAVKIPGSCVSKGGRTGYSVKLISRDAMLNSPSELGGSNASASLICNPPQAGGGNQFVAQDRCGG